MTPNLAKPASSNSTSANSADSEDKSTRGGSSANSRMNPWTRTRMGSSANNKSCPMARVDSSKSSHSTSKGPAKRTSDYAIGYFSKKVVSQCSPKPLDTPSSALNYQNRTNQQESQDSSSLAKTQSVPLKIEANADRPDSVTSEEESIGGLSQVSLTEVYRQLFSNGGGLFETTNVSEWHNISSLAAVKSQFSKTQIGEKVSADKQQEVQDSTLSSKTQSKPSKEDNDNADRPTSVASEDESIGGLSQVSLTEVYRQLYPNGGRPPFCFENC